MISQSSTYEAFNLHLRGQLRRPEYVVTLDIFNLSPTSLEICPNIVCGLLCRRLHSLALAKIMIQGLYSSILSLTFFLEDHVVC
jgi:hypothetical protein